MADIQFLTINSDYDKLDEIKKIYEEAFLPAERKLAIEDFFVLIGQDKNKRLISVTEGDEVVGFLVTIEAEKYIYGLYLATRSDLRGRGYGSKIMKALFEGYPDKTLIFAIETPTESAPNYLQRIKREAFYTRLGCVRAEYDLEMNGVDYTFMCSKMSENVRGYIDDFRQKNNL